MNTKRQLWVWRNPGKAGLDKQTEWHLTPGPNPEAFCQLVTNRSVRYDLSKWGDFTHGHTKKQTCIKFYSFIKNRPFQVEHMQDPTSLLHKEESNLLAICIKQGLGVLRFHRQDNFQIAFCVFIPAPGLRVVWSRNCLYSSERPGTLSSTQTLLEEIKSLFPFTRIWNFNKLAWVLNCVSTATV